MAMKKYPTAWAPRPAVLIGIDNSLTNSADASMTNPADIDMKAMVSLSRFGLPTAEKPEYANRPMNTEMAKPTRFAASSISN